MAGERAACRYLERRGYLLLASRYRNALGEIDLIMQDGEEIVFVEVKSRRQVIAGHPEEAVDGKKLSHIDRVGAVYLEEERLAHRDRRIDVVAVTYGKRPWPAIRHLDRAG